MIASPIRLVFVIGVVLGGCAAQAACPVVGPKRPPAGLEVVAVRGDADELIGVHRLGLDGRRVAAPSGFPRFVQRGNRIELEPIWQTQVDWAAYAVSSSLSVARDQPSTRLYFERQRDGSRRLCRIESLAVVQGAGGRAPQAAVARVAEFDYGAQGRLARVIEHFWRDVGEPGVWDRPSQVCYRYDAHGYPAGQLDGVTGDCAQASWSDAQARYVNADDGRLLRRLHHGGVMDARTLALLPTRFVDTYDAQGGVVHRYQYTEGAGAARLARPEDGRDAWRADELVLDDAIAIQIGAPNAAPDDRPDWRFDLFKAEFLTQDRFYLPEAIDTALAAGRADDEGMIALSPALEADLLEQVRSAPGRVVLRVGQDQYRLWPTVADAVWTACQDPGRNAPADCP